MCQGKVSGNGEKRRNRKAPTEAEKNERKSNLKIDSPRKKKEGEAPRVSCFFCAHGYLGSILLCVLPELTLEIENVYA